MNGLYPSQSRPYLAEASNITNESHFGAPVPIRFGQNNLLVSHGQQRNIHDNMSMSIVGQNPCGYPIFVGQPTIVPQLQQQQQQLQQFQPQPLASQMYPPSYYPLMNAPYSNNLGLQQHRSCTCCPQLSNPFQCNGNYPAMYKQITADGVDFTFGTGASGGYQQNPFCGVPQQTDNLRTQYDQLNLQQQIALKQLEKHSLETLLLQEQLKRNPFLLQFHHDKVTTTEDLFQGNDQRSISQAMPDMQAAAAQCLADNIDLVHNVRQLRLGKSPDLKYSSNQPPYAAISKTCVCNSRQANNNGNTIAKVAFNEQPLVKNIDNVRESMDNEFNEGRSENRCVEYSVEKPKHYKTKNQKKDNQYDSTTSINYSVEEPSGAYKLSSDERSDSSNNDASKTSDSEDEIGYKRLDGTKGCVRRNKRKNTKKQHQKK